MNKNENQYVGLARPLVARDLKYQLLGWILFIVCAIFFIASSLINGDILTFIGSVIFLIACVVFLIPLFRTIKKSGE
jgi:hypothetical protein